MINLICIGLDCRISKLLTSVIICSVSKKMTTLHFVYPNKFSYTDILDTINLGVISYLKKKMNIKFKNKNLNISKISLNSSYVICILQFK